MKKDVEAFRIFVKKHPKLIKEVRSNTRSWRDVYEDWVVLGENHDIWNEYKSNQKNQDENTHFRGLKERKQKPGTDTSETKKEITVGDLFSMFRDINVSEIGQHLAQFSGAIEGIHQLIKQFQGSKTPESPSTTSKDNYFSAYKD